MLSVQQAVDAHGGIATRDQLMAVGVTALDLASAIRRGDVCRVRRATFATGLATSAALAAVRVGGVLAGPSAAATWGLWAGFDRRIHVSVKANAGRLRVRRSQPRASEPPLTPDNSDSEIVVHWLVGGGAAGVNAECWRVPLLEGVRQTARWCDRETAIACIDTAHMFASRNAIVTTFAREPLSSRMLAAASRPGSESGTESLVRQRCAAIGIELVQQVQIAGVGRVDAGIRGTRIIIEVDGREYHDEPAAFERDRRRDAQLVALGYTVIRLTYRQVTRNWPWCERMIIQAMSRWAARSA